MDNGILLYYWIKWVNNIFTKISLYLCCSICRLVFLMATTKYHGLRMHRNVRSNGQTWIWKRQTESSMFYRSTAINSTIYMGIGSFYKKILSHSKHFQGKSYSLLDLILLYFYSKTELQIAIVSCYFLICITIYNDSDCAVTLCVSKDIKLL